MSERFIPLPASSVASPPWQWDRSTSVESILRGTFRNHHETDRPTVPKPMNTSLIARIAWALLTLLAATTALGQPGILSEPRTQFQWENRRVSLDVRVSGRTPFTFQWQFHENDIPGATNRFYTMPRVQTNEDGNYRVLITDPTGAITSKVARVMVRAWPKPTGPFIPELARLDTNMMNIMMANNVPGGSLAVVKDGRLILARGYGFADVENREPFQPDSLSRAASLSKLITAATAMKLVEDGKLDLDAPVLPILGLEVPDYPGAAFDSRWTNVTLRHCLNHTGGWNRDTTIDPLGGTGFDPSLWPERTAKDLKLQTAPTPFDMVRWMLGRPMQSSPGTQYVYSNFGYDVAGVLIERTAHLRYEEAAKTLLARAGITRLRLAGDTRSDRGPGEAVYYLHPSITSTWARWMAEPKPFDFDLPYAWPLSFYPAAGGWVISAIDYARLVASIDNDPTYPDILTTHTIATMVSRPKTSPVSAESYYGMGVNVRSEAGLWSHSGGDSGWRTYWVRTKGGVIYVVTFNTYSENLDLDSPFLASLDRVRQWPTHDFFANTLSYEAWETRHLGNRGAAAIGYGSDPDGDGAPNLVEYAQGTDPLAASPRPALTATLEAVDGQRTLTIGFRRLLLAHEVDYTIESSDDLATWSPLSGEFSEPTLNSDGTVTVHVRTAVAEATPARFFRLVVSRKKV